MATFSRTQSRAKVLAKLAAAALLSAACQAPPTVGSQITLNLPSTASPSDPEPPVPADPGTTPPPAAPPPSGLPDVAPFPWRQVSTVVGDGTDRVLLDPASVTVAPDGTLFVADQGIPAILRIGGDGQVIRFAGGVLGRKDGQGTAAQFWSARDLALLPNGSLAVADGDEVRLVSPAGDVTTLRPTGPDGKAWTWLQVFGVAADSSGNLYVSTLHQIDRVTPDGHATTLAGTGDPGFADGTGTQAAFDLPARISVAPDGSLVVADSGNNRIRRVSPAGQVTTIAGDGTQGRQDGAASGARFDGPEGVWVDPEGRILVADTGNSAIREIVAGQVRTVAGDGTAGFQDGPTGEARFAWPVAITGALVVDADNRRIRRLE